MSKNFCYCVSGTPSGGIAVNSNGDGTYTCPFIILDGQGDPECEGLIMIQFRDLNGDILFGATYELGASIQSPVSVSGITLTEFITNFRPYLTGTVENGSSFIFDFQNWSLVNGCNGNITIEMSFENPRCGTNAEGFNGGEIELSPPIARLSNEICIGGVSGVVTFDLEIKESDQTTPLVAGDPARFDVKDGLVVLETIEGIYGNDISVFNQTSGTASSVTLWATGLVMDGGTINFASKDYEIANGLGCKEFTICVSAYDQDQCSWNDNTDVSLVLPNTINMISTGTVPIAIGASSGSQYSVRGTTTGNPFQSFGTTDFTSTNNTFFYASVGTSYLDGSNDGNEAGANLLSGAYPTSDTILSLNTNATPLGNFSEYVNGTYAFNKRYVHQAVQALNNFTTSALVDNCAKIVTLTQGYTSTSLFTGSITDVTVNVYSGGVITPPTLTDVLASNTGTLVNTSSSISNTNTKVIDFSTLGCGVFYIETLITHSSGRVLQDIIPIIIS